MQIIKSATFVVFSFFLLLGCSNSGFSSWNEQTTFSFLQNVFDHTQEAYKKTYDTKDDIVSEFEKYFSSEISRDIADTLFEKKDKGWRVLEGDGKYIFFVPQRNNNNSIDITIQKDFIRVETTYELGMYSQVVYVIENAKSPIINKWMVK